MILTLYSPPHASALLRYLCRARISGSLSPRLTRKASNSPASGPIVFFDIPSKAKQCAWSPNTWKTRYSLNYKNIPYKTQWIEYPDIADHCKDKGIQPTYKKKDGSPQYTLPAIYDPSTGRYISDSLAIAQYLETTYPMTPTLFPGNSQGLQTAFLYAFRQQMTSLYQFIYAPECVMLNPRSAEYFRRTREETFGCTLEDLVPKGDRGEAEWAKFKGGLGRVNDWYAKSGGPFLMDRSPSWADFVVGAYLVWWRTVWSEESPQWDEISRWHGGRWKSLSDHLKVYEKVV